MKGNVQTYLHPLDLGLLQKSVSNSAKGGKSGRPSATPVAKHRIYHAPLYKVMTVVSINTPKIASYSLPHLHKPLTDLNPYHSFPCICLFS